MYESVAALQRKKFGEYFTKLGLQCGFWLALLYAILLALVIPIMLFQYFQNKAQEAPK